MASWIDEEIATWDPHAGSDSGCSIVGCLGVIIIGGALLILLFSIAEGVGEFIQGLGWDLPQLPEFDWVTALEELPNFILSVFRFIGNILYNIAQFIYSFW